MSMMRILKKELILHLIFTLVFFLLITILRRLFDLSYIPFWLGGIVGTFFPYTDSLIYAFFLRPEEPNSQQVRGMLKRGEFTNAIIYILDTRSERSKLLFHTILMQIVFLLFAFWVISSSANFFGKGFILGFVLSLSFDQLTELARGGNLDKWFVDFKLTLTREKALFYWILTFAFVLYLGFVA